MGEPRKSLLFIGSSKKDLRELPEDVKDVFGSALLDAQYGDHPDGARPFGEGLPRAILKLTDDCWKSACLDYASRYERRREQQ
jgi:phage-related protein